MSATEPPDTTLIRLLKTNLRIVKNNGALANVEVSGEYVDAEALRGFDGQVTVALADSVDQKLELSGKMRRCAATLRVNVWATGQAGSGESAKALQAKIVAEVNRVIREKRMYPNETIYSFYGLGAASETHQAYSGSEDTAPDAEEWQELTSTDYAKLWTADNDCYAVSHSGSGQAAALLLRFKVASEASVAKKIACTFVGYGTGPLATALGKSLEPCCRCFEQGQSGFAGTNQTLTFV
jgi:hypothetical protein